MVFEKVKENDCVCVYKPFTKEKNMNKIAIVTINANKNYGNKLQNYAI